MARKSAKSSTSVRGAAVLAEIPPLEPVIISAKRDRLTVGGRKNISYFVTPATRKRLRQYALDHDTSLQSILDDALDDYCVAHGLGAIERVARRKANY
jgi:hypothetical protein